MYILGVKLILIYVSACLVFAIGAIEWIYMKSCQE